MNLKLGRPDGTPEDAWALFQAAANGDLPAIQQLLDANPEHLHHQIWYEFPLHFAVRGGHLKAVDLLLEAGTNPARSFFNYSSWQKLLPMAKDRDHEAIYERLISEMRQRFHFNPNHETLWKAIEQGQTATVERLVKEQPDLVHLGDCHGNRALHWAVLSRQIPIIETLLEAGSDLQARRADQQTSLHLTLSHDYWFRKKDKTNPGVEAKSVTGLLLDRGAEYEFSAAAFRGDLPRIREILAGDPGAATRLNESQRSPLGHAARGNQHEVVRLLLERGADPNLPEECADRGAALFIACDHKNIEIVRLLLEHGADPNAEFDSSGNCLSIADYRPAEGSAEVIRILRKYGAKEGIWSLETPARIRERLRTDPSLGNDTSFWGGILQTVISADDVSVLKEFIETLGSDRICNMNPANGWNLAQSSAMLDALLRHGMDIHRTDWLGQTYLHVCASGNHIERAGWHLERGIELEAIDFAHNTTALGIAAKNGHPDMVEFLLEKGAEAEGPRALAERANQRKTELILRTHLVRKQLATDPDSLLSQNSNALHSAAHYSEEEIVLALLEAGADLEAEHPRRGGKPLHWATEGSVKICKELVDRGANIHSRVVSDDERNGMTPLIYCAWWCGDDAECLKIAEFLIDAGADITAKDAEGKTAVERARQQGHDHLAEALAARGCD